MKQYFAVLLLIIYITSASAQASFKVIFKTYPTGSIQHIYNYDYLYKDEFHLFYRDSTVIYISKDSMVIMTEQYPTKEKMICTVDYYNTKKQLVKTEHFIEDYLMKITEWKYDTMKRIIYHSEKETDSKTRSYVRSYSFEVKKTPEGVTETEYCKFNGKPEFSTINYYDKKHQIYKQVRENDAHKAIHIETYNYSSNGKLLSREIFFPEFGITKYYKEKGWDTKCNKTMPLTGDYITEENKEQVLIKEMNKNKNLLLNSDCPDMEFIFTNFANTISFSKESERNTKTASISIKERMK